MVMKLGSLTFNRLRRIFARWKIEVNLWSEITYLSKNRIDIALALSLQENDPICKQVMEGISLDDLRQDDCLQILWTAWKGSLAKMISKIVLRSMKIFSIVNEPVAKR